MSPTSNTLGEKKILLGTQEDLVEFITWIPYWFWILISYLSLTYPCFPLLFCNLSKSFSFSDLTSVTYMWFLFSCYFSCILGFLPSHVCCSLKVSSGNLFFLVGLTSLLEELEVESHLGRGLKFFQLETFTGSLGTLRTLPSIWIWLYEVGFNLRVNFDFKDRGFL